MVDSDHPEDPNDPDRLFGERIRSGDSTAWDEAYRRHWPVIVRFFEGKRVGKIRLQRNEAMDPAHETFVRALATCHRFKGGRAEIGRWLQGFASKIYKELVKKSSSRLSPSPLPPDLPAAECGGHHRIEIIIKAWKSLTERQRQLIRDAFPAERKERPSWKEREEKWHDSKYKIKKETSEAREVFLKRLVELGFHPGELE